MSDSTSSEPRLPVELAERVIDCLRDDRASLLACEATCQSWLPHARWHLYRTIALALDHLTPASRALRFLDALQANPPLGALVDELELTFDRPPDLSQVLAANLDPPAADDWPTALGLGRLHNVRALRLAYAQFDGLADLLALARLFPRLARLTLRGVRVRRLDADVRLAPEQELRSLAIGDTHEQQLFDGILPGFRPGGAFSRLETLAVDDAVWEPGRRLAWMRVPALLRATLRELRVNWSRWAPPNAEGEREVREECAALVDALWTCTALRALAIQNDNLHRGGRFPGSPYRALAERFAASDAPLRELRELALLVRAWAVPTAERGLGEHVARLAETLLDRARFPSLERVVVRISSHPHDAQITEATISSAAELAAWRLRTCDTPANDVH